MKSMVLKKVLGIALGGLIMVMGLMVVLPVQSVQATGVCGTNNNLVQDQQTGLCIDASSRNAGNVNDLIIRVVNFILAIAATVAVLFLVIGGFRVVTAGGSEEGVTIGRTYITNAAFGLVIIILAYVIVSVVNNSVSGSGNVLSRIFGR